jgi:N-acetylglucosaminyl-diphospho-decaprenol L-rhamnosyltransferase
MDRAEYLAMGGLDARLFLFFNDVDLCRRLWTANRRIHYLAEAEVMHHGGASTRGYHSFVVTWHRNRLAYYRKHYGRCVVPYMRAIVRMRACEEWIRAGRRHRDAATVRAERDFLKRCLSEILAP